MKREKEPEKAEPGEKIGSIPKKEELRSGGNGSRRAYHHGESRNQVLQEATKVEIQLDPFGYKSTASTLVTSVAIIER